MLEVAHLPIRSGGLNLRNRPVSAERSLAGSSTAFVMLRLVEQRRAGSPVGRAALGILVFQGLLVAPILIFVGFAGREGGQDLGWVILEALMEGSLVIGDALAMPRQRARVSLPGTQPSPSFGRHRENRH